MLWLAVVLAVGQQAVPCSGARVSPRAAALLRPVLAEFLSAHAEEFDEAGRYVRESPHSKIFEERFEKLLTTRGAAANEAVAALLAFYVGEHAGEELVCSAINRGKPMRRHLERFQTCAPITGLEPIPAFFTAIPNMRVEVLSCMDAGEGECKKRCQFE